MKKIVIILMTLISTAFVGLVILLLIFDFINTPSKKDIIKGGALGSRLNFGFC